MPGVKRSDSLAGMRAKHTGMWVGCRGNAKNKAGSWIPAFAGMTK
jgi:hypothetical protein